MWFLNVVSLTVLQSSFFVFVAFGVMLTGADPGEVKWMNFHPPFSEPLFNHADVQTSNTSTRLWFYYIITKIHPPFQNPGSAPGLEDIVRHKRSSDFFIHMLFLKFHGE